MSNDSLSTRMTYGNYLRLPDLLSLQSGPEGYAPPSNHEMHFIVVHQAFELWFKLILRELEEAKVKMGQNEIGEEEIRLVVQHLERVSEIFRLLAQQWKVMETMSPLDFLSFRDRLGTSSGFESWQLRQIEFVMGLSNDDRVGGMNPLEHMKKLSDEGKISRDIYNEVHRIASSASLNDVLQDWLSRTPIHGSQPFDAEDANVVSTYIEQHIASMQNQIDVYVHHATTIGHMSEEQLRPRLEANITAAREFFFDEKNNVQRNRAGLLFIESYRHLPLLSWPQRLLDCFIELEESMLLFRSHHARMVERMIGRRIGTGGSSGVDYLDATSSYRIFKDLWNIRTLLVKQSATPTLANIEYYDFSKNRI
ncbi:MAG: tryptophan 2,3-dioxygenase family protein [archaeon]|nr:tryptophan 2,3-dioxygenase family protein [archaeon]MDA0843035.1 tryptophan 2,3-dioxygenase family protein [archaeon]